jgi:hypothetical protein
MTATLHFLGTRVQPDAGERAPSAGSSGQALHRLLFGANKALRALAALDDDDIGNLSETGRRLRREARQQLRTAGTGRLRRTGFRSAPAGSSR